MIRTGLLILSAFVFFVKSVSAQNSQSATPRIALFVPLYLDSVFDAAGNYKPGKIVPRYLNPALEFYQGATLALDSLDSENVKLSVKVFDTKNPKQSIYKIADSGGLDSTDIIIGAVSGSEYIDLATVAKEKKIPFISATYPNDGGISGNPYVVIVNSKLNTHLQAIYNYVLRNFGTNKLVMVRRKNPADDRVVDVFKSLNASGSGQVLNIQTVTAANVLSVKDLLPVLDKVRENVIISASLDDNFAKGLLALVASLPAYKITIVGMPTWSDFPELANPELKNIPIFFSSSFFNPGSSNAWADGFIKAYARNTYTAPTETAFRGYELTYFFAHLLTQHHKDIIANLTETDHRILSEFDFRPIHWSKNSTTPDYYENKRIYILKALDGEISKAN